MTIFLPLVPHDAAIRIGVPTTSKEYRSKIFSGYKNSKETVRLANELPLISSRTRDHQSVALLSDRLEPLNEAVPHINTRHDQLIL